MKVDVYPNINNVEVYENPISIPVEATWEKVTFTVADPVSNTYDLAHQPALDRDGDYVLQVFYDNTLVRYGTDYTLDNKTITWTSQNTPLVSAKVLEIWYSPKSAYGTVPGSGEVTALNHLSDVSIEAPLDGHLLIRNASNKFVNKPLRAGDSITITTNDADVTINSNPNLPLTKENVSKDVLVNRGYAFDTANANLTATLPAAPVMGDVILIIRLGAGDLTVANNGHKINGVVQNFAVSDNEKVTFTYIDNNVGWLKANEGVSSLGDLGTLQVSNGVGGFNSVDWNFDNNNLLPKQNETYSIGSADKRIKDLFIANKCIYFGENNVEFGLNSAGKLQFDNKEIGVSSGFNVDLTTLSANEYLKYDGSKWINATISTDVLSEATNLFYTDARARASISVTDAGGDGSLAYDNSTGVITYNGPSESEVRAHFSSGTGVSINAGSISIGQSVGTNSDVTFNKVTAPLVGNVTGTVSDISNHNTDSLSEGSTNQYHTASRARASISVTDNGGDGSLAYDDTTGVITYNGPSANDVRAHISAGTGVSINNGQISIGQSVDTSDNVNFYNIEADGNLTVAGDLTVGGTTTTVNTTNTTISDKLFSLAEGTSGTPSGDVGLILNRGSSDSAFIGFDESAEKFAVGTGSFTGSSTGDINYTKGTLLANVEGDLTGNVTGNVVGNVTGDLTGNSDTTTKLATAVNIAGKSFDGTSNIDVEISDLSDVANDTPSEGNVLRYNDTSSKWEPSNISSDAVTEGSNLYYTDARADARIAAADTDDVSEGSSNLYFTNARADARIAAANTDNLSEGSSNLYYSDARVDARIAATDTDSLSQGSSNLYSTAELTRSHFTYGTGISHSAGALSVTQSDINTDNITEGSTNQFHTDAKARASISVSDAGGDGSLTYNSSSGVITYTGPSPSDFRAHLSATGDVTYDSSSGVISYTSPWTVSSGEITTSNLIVHTGQIFEKFDMGGASLTNSPDYILDAGSINTVADRIVDCGGLHNRRLF